ncbi:hypothetical protein [Corynebacterium rouxii]|uniref:hypothetical protein n=1 Tax=Corynebacterium rouxii TaxID=2719119 RepID=UPI00313D95CB
MTIPILRCEPEPITRGWLCLLLLVVVTVGIQAAIFAHSIFQHAVFPKTGWMCFPAAM